MGSTVTHWLCLKAGSPAPLEIMLQFYAQALASSQWEHRAFWGGDYWTSYGTAGQASRRQQSSSLPATGHWVPLTVQLGPTLASAGPATDVGMGGHQLGGVAYVVYGGGGGTVWWGPTVLDMPPANPVTDARHTTTTFAYNQMNDQIATVDPNGIASVTDFDAHGQARQVSSGVHAPQPTPLLDDSLFYRRSDVTKPCVAEFVNAPTGAADQPSTGTKSTPYHGYGSLNQPQTHSPPISHLSRHAYALRPRPPHLST